MSTLPAKKITITDLLDESQIVEFQKQDIYNSLLNENPPQQWVKQHPYIKQEVEINGEKKKVPYFYLPIDKVEFLLRRIFKRYRIEVLREGTAFNGVYVVVKVHFFDPVNMDWDWRDGIGAIELQVKAGSSPSDLANINKGALSMAFPLAKTLAIKDACDTIGRIFGADLNRRDTLSYTLDPKITETFTKSNTAKMGGKND